MIKRLLLSLFFALAPVIALAQVQVQVGATTATMNACPAGQFLDGTIVSNVFHCTAAPAGGGNITIAGSGCISVSGSSPSFTIGTQSPAVSVPGTITVDATSNCKWFIYTGAAAGVANILAANATGVANGFGFILEVPKTSGQLTLNSTSAFHGGPTILLPGSSAIIQADDKGQWAMFVGASQVIPNPNVFK